VQGSMQKDERQHQWLAEMLFLVQPHLGLPCSRMRHTHLKAGRLQQLAYAAVAGSPASGFSPAGLDKH
jgi:hypothetical protein